MRDSQNNRSVIEQYMEDQPDLAKPHLLTTYEAIRSVIPDAKEKISWRMPTFYDTRNIIHFCAFKAHMGLYPGQDAIVHFKKRLQPYRFSKGAIQFPYDEPLPVSLIQEITLWVRTHAGN
jgi:uncharacterized protein YdhG (YjbR/CyaY superfamily)